MLVSEGKTSLKRFGFDDTDPLLIWMNAGMRELERAHTWTFLQSSVVVASSGDAFTLPTDFVKVYSIRDMTTGAKLVRLSTSQFERDIEDPTDTGAPQLYRVIGTSDVQVWPLPDFATTYQVVYRTKFTDMSSDVAQMPGPVEIHYPIIQGASYLALQAENEEERAKNAQAQFLAAIDGLWNTYGDNDEDEPQQVVDVMGYGG